MDRKFIYIGFALGLFLILGLGGTLIYKLATSSGGQDIAEMDTVKRHVPLIADPYAGREADAIDIIQRYEVWNPEYIEALKTKKLGDWAAQDKPQKVTIASLVEANFLETQLHMEDILKRGEWRALHLDTDSGSEQTPDPQYEVYLDYRDGEVVVGPVWIVDLSTKVVVPRNNMASIFDRNPVNYDQIEEEMKRSASVVRAITSHRFESGIDLGGVFLLHFLKQTQEPKHANDEIIGWTVMHELDDEYSAYFQWKELNETRVAKFKFNWETKSLTPVGLLAVDLMALGNNMDSVAPVNIYPNDYTNNLGIPRNERWARGHACRNRDYKDLCTAFVKVLEQQEFINALAWLLTNGEPDATRRVNLCKEQRKCGWVPKIAPDEDNPDKRSDLIKVEYNYELNQRTHQLSFLVDSKNETITPLDKLSQWAYWSVSPRT